jgi:hypothetical protein
MNDWPSSSSLQNVVLLLWTLPTYPLWPLLDLISASKPRTGDFKLKLVIKIRNRHFYWTPRTPDDEMAKFMGALVPHTKLLQAQGIYIVDQDERSLFD